MNQELLKKIEADSLRKEPLTFSVGDTVKVHVKVVEGDKERIQVFAGEGVERVFPVHSPRVDKVVVDRYGSVRRAKLHYLRGRIGKAAMLVKEKDMRRRKA